MFIEIRVLIFYNQFQFNGINLAQSSKNSLSHTQTSKKIVSQIICNLFRRVQIFAIVADFMLIHTNLFCAVDQMLIKIFIRFSFDRTAKYNGFYYVSSYNKISRIKRK